MINNYDTPTQDELDQITFENELAQAKQDSLPKPLLTQDQKDNTPEGQCPACYHKCKHEKHYNY